MLPAVEAVNLTPSSIEFESFWITIGGVVIPEKRLEGGGTLIVTANVADPVPKPLVALNVTLDVPAAVGVPAMTPVVVLIESPAGNPAALKLVGFLVAVIV